MFDFLDMADDMNMEDDGLNSFDDSTDLYSDDFSLDSDMPDFSSEFGDNTYFDSEASLDSFEDTSSHSEIGDSISFGSRTSEYDMREVESELEKASNYQDKADEYFEKADRANKDGRYADAARETEWGNKELERANMHKEFAERARKRV